MSEQNAKRPESVNAIAGLEFAMKLAETVRDSADSYLQAIKSTPRCEVEVGHFYSTFDGSLVYAARPYTRCKCAICSGRQGGGVSLIGYLFGNPVMGSSPPDDHRDDGDADLPKRFIVSLLRGGHGLTNTPGEKAGEIYIVDHDGLTVVNNPEKLDSPQTDKVICGMAGLCLKQRLNVSFQAVES